MSGPTGSGQYTHSIMWQLVNYECINCTHWYVTTVVILPFWFTSLIHNSIFMNAGSSYKLCQTGRNHIFCMHVFVWCCLVLLFRAGNLIVSWLRTAHQYMLDLLGDVTPTVSSCPTFQGVCVTQKSVCIKFSCFV